MITTIHPIPSGRVNCVYKMDIRLVPAARDSDVNEDITSRQDIADAISSTHLTPSRRDSDANEAETPRQDNPDALENVLPNTSVGKDEQARTTMRNDKRARINIHSLLLPCELTILLNP